MKQEKESGAIVVEATISLTAFIFAIFTILMLIDICYVQAKIGSSLNTTAKEISQYAYLYYKFNSDEFQSDLNKKAEESRKTAKNTIDGIGTFMDAMSGAKDSLSTGDFDGMVEEINKGKTEADSIITMYSEQLEDPKAFIIGMANLAASDGTEMLKNQLFGKLLGRSMMKKNLVAYKNDDADSFLKRNRVVGGLDGLDFTYTSLMAYGETNQIRMVVTYEVQVIKLLNLDFKFKFRQKARTSAWGNGISLISPRKDDKQESSIWDLGPTSRGKTIVLEEKVNYEYTSTGSGFDAYVNDGGANEYVTITSINTHDKSYLTADGIKKRISSSYNDMYSKVTALDEDIKVMDKKGEIVNVKSPKDTRTYTIVVVVPDDADMEIVEQARQDFINTRAESGENVKVEIKTGYGSPTEKKDEGKTEE